MDISGLLKSSATRIDDAPEAEPEPDALTPDPKAAHRVSEKSGRRERPKGKLPTTQAGKKKLEQEIRDNLTMFLGLGSGMLMKLDPHCVGAFATQLDPIVDALVPIIMRNANLLRWFAGSDARYLEYLALARALAPVASTVLKHHVIKGSADGGVAPIGNAYDLSSFSAPSF